MMPASPAGPPTSVRLQHSPSPLMQSAVSIPSSVAHQSNLQSPLFSQQLQMVKPENKNWSSPLKMSQVIDLNYFYQRLQLFELGKSYLHFLFSELCEKIS